MKTGALPPLRMKNIKLNGVVIPSIAFTMLFIELAERCSWYANKSITQTFMSRDMESFFGMTFTNQDAQVISQLLKGVAYITPLLGAWVGQRYGKTQTIIGFGFLCALGHVLLSLSLGLTNGLPFFMTALMMISFMGGALKPVNTALYAAIFQGYTDSERHQAMSIFYFMINVGSVISDIVTPTLRDTLGYHIAYLLPCVMMFVSVGTLYFVRKQFTPYNLVIAPTTASEKKDTDGFKIRPVVVFMSFFILLWGTYNLYDSAFNADGAFYDRKLWGMEISFDIIKAINPITLIVGIPLTLWLEKKFNINISGRKRVLIGMCMVLISVGLAAILRYLIHTEFTEKGIDDHEIKHAVQSSYSVLWMLLIQTIMALSEIFFSIQMLKLALDYAPAKHKGLVLSIGYLMQWIGSLYISGATALSGYLQWEWHNFYLILGGILLINTVAYGLYIQKVPEKTYE